MIGIAPFSESITKMENQAQKVGRNQEARWQKQLRSGHWTSWVTSFLWHSCHEGPGVTSAELTACPLLLHEFFLT